LVTFVDQFNPYESPVYPDEVTVVESAESLTATFSIEVADQWMAIETMPSPVSPRMLIMAGIVLVTCVPAWLMFQDAGILIACLVGLFLVGFMFSIQYFHRQQFRREALQALRDHPVLGATGPWKLTVRGDRLIVETDRGTRQFLRSRTRIWDSGHQLVLWLDSLPILIPQYESYAPMCDALRRRLRM
jgi:hypothetical protein